MIFISGSSENPSEAVIFTSGSSENHSGALFSLAVLMKIIQGRYFR